MRPESLSVPKDTWCNPGFRGLIRVSFGKADSLTMGYNDDQPRHDIHFDCANTETLSHLRSVIELACVGLRLVLTGPAVDIKAAAAVVSECGMAEEEVVLLSDESGPCTVFCAHCRTANSTTEPVGSELECQGCSTVLSISDHFSRRIAAYLGFAAHVEEAA